MHGQRPCRNGSSTCVRGHVQVGSMYKEVPMPPPQAPPADPGEATYEGEPSAPEPPAPPELIDDSNVASTSGM